MLMTTEKAVLAKHLIFNKLQNESFFLAKCAVLQVKTGRIAVRNGTYGNSRRQKLFFSCISASMGRLRIFKKAKIKLNKKELHSKRVVSTLLKCSSFLFSSTFQHHSLSIAHRLNKSIAKNCETTAMANL